MSSSAGQEWGDPAPDGSRSGPALVVIEGGASDGAAFRNPLATASLIAGAAGISVITILPGLILGVFGLRRAGRAGRGAARCWIGIGSALAWAALAGYLLPHLLQAADPGCRAYKGPGLTAYGKVIADFNAAGPRTGVARDLGAAIASFRAAAAQSGDRAAASALTGFAADLQVVLSDIRARTGVHQRELRALNTAAARTDQACGTLRL
jgi:hypothetical protein